MDNYADMTVSFKTSPKIKESLEQIAAKQKASLSSVIESIIRRYLESNDNVNLFNHNRRRFERKTVTLPAYLGKPDWQRHRFVKISILDISSGGVRFSLSKDAAMKIRNSSDLNQFLMIFRLSTSHWPIHVQAAAQRIIESQEEIQVGAVWVKPDFNSYSALQQYMN